jgi:hypothetical protein
MATTYHTLQYTIWLTDAEQVKTLQAARARIDNGAGVLVELNPSRITDPGALYAAPATAAALYSATILTPILPNIPPSITSEWITNNTNNPNYPLDEYKFERKSGGWFGISWLFGDTHVYRWRGTFAYKPTNAVIDGIEETPDDIPVRYFIEGFENSNTDVRQSRDASRHTDGLGHKAVASSSAKVTHSVDENDAAATTVTDAWERFYMRRRGSPSTATAFWLASFLLGMEMVLKILPTGQLMVGDGEGASFIPMATTADPIPDGEWVKIDVIYHVNNTGDAPYLKLYINGVLVLSVSGFSSTFANVGCYLDNSSLGIGLNDTSNTVALDFDDWICAAPPTVGLSIDWLNGTKIVKVPFLQVGDDDTGGWTYSSGYIGNARSASATRDDAFTSNVASAVVELVGDPDPYKLDRGAIGPVCARVGVVGQRTGAGGNDYALGYSVAGGAIVYGAAHTFGVGATLKTAMYQPAAVSDPTANVFDPISVALRNESGVPGTTTVNLMFLEVELVGIWGPEDVSAASILSPEELSVLGNTGKHNSPYPNSVWARPGMPPVSPVFIKSGTFSGNGTSQLLSFNAPVTYLFVRELTGGTNRSAHWWSSMNAGGTGDSEGIWEHNIADLRQVGAGAAAEDDQEYTYELRVAGSDANDNRSGSTYWYVAIMDPGMRFSLNAALATHRPTTPLSTPLVMDTWTPEAAFTRREAHSTTITGSTGLKGISDVAGGGITRVGIAYNANGLTLAAGSITTGSDWNTLWGDGQLAVALWRRDDGSGDPGVNDVIQLLTWVGDGTASRSIAFSRPTGDKYPLFAIVWPNSTGTVGYRDPQNTGTTSYTSNGATYSANASTGITAGNIDQITVGSVFNANGVVYNAFVIVGGTVAGNNGWSADGEFIPVEPTEPLDWPGIIPQTEIPDPLPIDWIGDGAPADPENPVEPEGSDFGDQCVDASTKVCRQALSHIGVTQTITDITTDLTPEAEMCRLHYADAVAEALREFPWAFATKYADCARVGGTEDAPVNGDWIYSYRMPTDCIFARRIVRPEKGREYDDDPPKFRQGGSDATGRLIFSNYADPEGEEEPLNTLPLEYTYRPNCAATQGDALFRQALSWLVASKLAPALSRNKMTAGEAWRMYQITGMRAMAVNSREQQQYTEGGEAPWIEDR